MGRVRTLSLWAQPGSEKVDLGDSPLMAGREQPLPQTHGSGSVFLSGGFRVLSSQDMTFWVQNFADPLWL